MRTTTAASIGVLSVAAAVVGWALFAREDESEPTDDGVRPPPAAATTPAALAGRAPQGADARAEGGRADAGTGASAPPSGPSRPAASRWISGVVVDEGGHPVAGALVDALVGGGAAPAGFTDVDGAFRVEDDGPANAPVEVRVRARGYATTLQPVARGEALARIRLEKRGASIAGVVLDPSGNGVEGVEVRTEASFGQTGTIFREPPRVDASFATGRGVARTAASGAFVLADLAAGAHSIRALGKGAWAPSVPVEVTAPLSDVELRLRVGGVVEGVVRDERGDPVPGAYVEVWPTYEAGWEHGADGSTDEAGRFRFEGLLPGVTRVEVEADGFLEAARPDVAVGEALVFVLERERVLRFRAVTESGDPVPPTPWATVLDRTGADVFPDQRFGDGRLLVGPLGVGPYRVIVGADGMQSVTFDDVRGDDPERTVTLREGLAVEGVFVGEALGASVEIYAVPSGIAQVAPAGDPMLAWPHSRRQSGSLDFRIDGLKPGLYDLVALPCDNEPDFGSVVVGRVEAGSKDVRIALPSGGSIRGRVRGPDGAPVPVARVQAYDERGLCRSYVARTVAVETFELKSLPAGRFDVVAWVAGKPVRAEDVVAPTSDLVLTVPP